MSSKVISRQFSNSANEELAAILKEFPNKKSALLMVLRLAEREFGFLDDGAMELVANSCGVSSSHVLGMVTFYTHFKRPHHGKHRLMVCATLMCSLGGPEGNCDHVLGVVKDRLGINAGERTEDGLFSVEKVECLADCNRPPVLQKDHDHYTLMNRDSVGRLIDELLKKEGLSLNYYSTKKSVPMDGRIPFIPVKHSVH